MPLFIILLNQTADITDGLMLLCVPVSFKYRSLQNLNDLKAFAKYKIKLFALHHNLPYNPYQLSRNNR